MRRSNRKSLYLGAALVVVLLLALALAGCGSSSTTTAAPTTTSGGATTTAAPAGSTTTTPAASTTTAAPAGGTIKIGFSGPLTGDGAVVGQDYLNGAKLYLEKINAAGGIKGQQVEIVSEDDVMDPKNSTTVAQKLVDAGVVAVLGPLTSGTTIPTLNIYGGASIAQLTPASNPDVTNQGVSTVFRVDPDDYAQGGNVGLYCYNTLKMKTAAVINDKQAFGQGVSEQFAASFEKAGGKITSTNGINSGDVDFHAVLTKVAAENPDMIYYGGIYKEAGLVVKQMREAGMKQVFFGPDQCYNPEFIKTGGTATEGAYVSYQGPPLDSTPELKAFTTEYTTKYGAGPIVAQFGYVSMQLIESAINTAGQATGKGIADALHANTYKTILGPYAFESNGAMKNGGTIYIYQVKNGAFAFVGASYGTQ